MPISPEILALNIADGMFPFASETMTTDEETVEGKTERKNKPIQINCCCSLVTSGKNARTNSGNNKKVLS